MTDNQKQQTMNKPCSSSRAYTMFSFGLYAVVIFVAVAAVDDIFVIVVVVVVFVVVVVDVGDLLWIKLPRI